MELDSAARRVDEVGVELVDVARRLRVTHPPAAAFGADASGALGDLGRALAAQSAAAITARAAEATALGGAASALATTVIRATAAYRETDSRRGTGRTGGA